MTRTRDKQPRGPEPYLSIYIGLNYNATDERLEGTISGSRYVGGGMTSNSSGAMFEGLPARHQFRYPDTAGRAQIEPAVFAALAPWLDKIVPRDDAATDWE